MSKGKSLKSAINKTKARSVLVESDKLKDKLKRLIRGRNWRGNSRLLDICRSLDAAPDAVEEAVDKLHEEGVRVRLQEGFVHAWAVAPPGVATHVSRVAGKDGWLRFGLLGDTQLGNRKQRLDVLKTAYAHFAAEGIDTVYHTGNLVDGYLQKINAFELIPEAGTSIESQAEYARAVYPKHEGITTYFVTGECHEGWWAKQIGVEVGRVMQDRFRLPLACQEHEYGPNKRQSRGTNRPFEGVPEDLGPRCRDHIAGNVCKLHGREDLVYLGHEEADVELRTPRLDPKVHGPVLRILHPGSGTAYALSYKTQKLAESLQGGEKPQIQAVGHYHKFDYNFHREVHNIMTGCLEDQTLFMRKNMLAAHVGYLVVDMRVTPDGAPQRVRVEWVPFYDQGFYKKYEKH